MVDRVEAGIGAVDAMEEREHVYAPEGAGERTVDESQEVAEGSTGKPIDVGNELRLILHQEWRGS
jgi:hypothetical protein